jgi:IclR family transcriptional regulator, KDG regulon repressor
MKSKDTNPKKVTLIQSIQRAADILELFLNEDNVLGISDFAEKLNLPKTTVQGIVRTLASLNYLEKDLHSAKYRLGPVLLHLGFQYAKNMDLITESMVWIERLSFKFRMTVNVCIRVGNKVLVLYCIEPKERYSTFFNTGAPIDIHTTASGKVLYAYTDKNLRDKALAEYSFQPYTDKTITTLNDFLVELEKVKQNGYACAFSEGFTPTDSIGAPIFNNKGKVLAAFAIVGKPEEINRDLDDIMYEVKKTSFEISKRLGYLKK